MSQKLFKILLVTVLTIGIVILGVILVRAKNKKDAAEINTNIENPFGVDSQDTSFPDGDPSKNSNNQTDENIDQTSDPIKVDFVSFENNPIFKKFSEEPVAGASFVYVEREIVVPEEASENVIATYDFTGYPNLKFGDDRKEVADLKTVLNRQDPSPALSVDNAFDTTLKNAIIDFQIRNNFTPDGVVGSVVYKKLNDIQGIKPKTTKGPETETIEFVRFVDRSNGYIFDKTTELDEPVVRVTSSAIPRVYEAYFGNTKDSILMRYLKDGKVENYLANIQKPTLDVETPNNRSTLEGKLFSDKISFVSLSANAQKFVYLTKEDGGSNAFTYDFKTKQVKKVWTSKFSDWIPQFISDNSLSLTPRASGLISSNSYILDIKNDSLKKVISGVYGLTTNISPDGKKIIYSSYEGGVLKTNIMVVASGQISSFSPTTLPEKCTWTNDSKFAYCGGSSTPPPGLYPDDWYKGEVLFNDMLWRIDIEQNSSKIIMDSSKMPVKLDLINPILNDKQDYLIFMNKYDNLLYGIGINRLEVQ